MTRLHCRVLAGALVLGMASAADAAVLDFSAFSPGFQGTNTLILPEATVTGLSDELFLGGGGIPISVCSIAGSNCVGSLEIAWNFDVTDVAFDFGHGDPGDQATITGFDAFGAQVGQVLLDLESGFDHASLGFGPVRSIVFDNSLSTGGGYAYGNIEYTASVAAVPLPATLPLVLAALAGLGLIGRKRLTA